ncbi:MAG: aspartate aminotransferase family protein [Rhodospirillaceae bacterium]|nr:aspartate aminotransferase family protein [Rhodospirillaceae bacterium]MBT5525183.1 aspartate aminotransferase family protein [Rhodospirillaceae bacterium]MBT6590253.1 aspartate aminotransferase family protein [Rhodospirillaceae bacterium]MBT6911419.1 aspartate aminotransferase family protein [Rhodospirillaceae bacterium]MBT7287468.1 aspartate aminotransferase family protein [Rhodospirillaceae bacterium]
MNKPVTTANVQPNDLEQFWMPFTSNREFKAAPRLLVSAKGMHYKSHDGRDILDGSAGLWCVNIGHGHPKVVQAIKDQADTLEFTPSFQFSQPLSFDLAQRLSAITPEGLDRIFFTNSGSEAVDTALKIALAYHRVRGEGTRTRLIGRERGYHGVGFGGISVGGIPTNRKFFGPLMNGVDHLPHTHNLEKNAFTKGQPEWGAHLADDLENLIALHDASTIAAVIVEPMAGSTGVLVPPKGYLERLRAITKKHGILLIFDEVITGFGRLGSSFASEYFGVTPDMFTMAKGLTSGYVPMGAVAASNDIYQAFMDGSPEGIELFHGYTYSAHPLACAAAVATLQVYEEEGLFQRAADMTPYWQEAVHSMKDLPNVIDIRNIGLVAGIELSAREGAAGKRGMEACIKAYEAGLMVRVTGDIIALSPPLILEERHIDQMVEITSNVIRDLD